MIKEVKIEDLEPFRVIDGAFVIDMAFCDDFDMKINSIDKAKEISLKDRKVIDSAYLIEEKVDSKVEVIKVYADSSGSMYSRFVTSSLDGYNLIKAYEAGKTDYFYIYIRENIPCTFLPPRTGGDLCPWLTSTEPEVLLDPKYLKIVDTKDPDNLCEMIISFDISTSPKGTYILNDNGKVVHYGG